MSPRVATCVAVVGLAIWLPSCGGSTSQPGSQTNANTGTGAPASSAGAASGQRPAAGPGGHSPNNAGASQAGRSSATANGNHRGYVDPLAAAPSNHIVETTEVVHTTSQRGATIVQQGLVTGPPIGNGTVVTRDTVSATGVTSSFTVTGPEGTVTGEARVGIHISGAAVTYRGTARLTRGTGRYSRVRAPNLTVAGDGDIQGMRMIIHVTGTEWY